jgi:anti-anti-sigma factor
VPIACEDYGKVCVVSVRGDLVGRQADDLCHVIEDRLRRGSGNVVIDLEQTGFMSSEGLEALLEVRRQCISRHRDLKLARLDDNCRKILELTRLEHRFECHADLNAAMKVME